MIVGDNFIFNNAISLKSELVYWMIDVMIVHGDYQLFLNNKIIDY